MKNLTPPIEGDVGYTPPLKVHGVGRVLENKNVLYIAFSREPTDEELRDVHDHMRKYNDR